MIGTHLPIEAPKVYEKDKEAEKLKEILAAEKRLKR